MTTMQLNQRRALVALALLELYEEYGYEVDLKVSKDSYFVIKIHPYELQFTAVSDSRFRVDVTSPLGKVTQSYSSAVFPQAISYPAQYIQKFVERCRPILVLDNLDSLMEWYKKHGSLDGMSFEELMNNFGDIIKTEDEYLKVVTANKNSEFLPLLRERISNHTMLEGNTMLIFDGAPILMVEVKGVAVFIKTPAGKIIEKCPLVLDKVLEKLDILSRGAIH